MAARVEDGAAELDVKAFQTFLREVVPTAIGGSVGELNDALELDPALMQSFIGGEAADAHGSVFVVVRNIREEKTEAADGDGADDGAALAEAPPFEVSTKVGFTGSKQATFTLIKRVSGPLFAATGNTTLQQQLLMITYAEGSPFETLHSYIRHSVGPYLNSAVNVQRAGDIVGKTNIARAVAELELQLTHLQQNVDIPEITLKANQKVKEVVALAASESRKPTVADFGDLVENADFLNALQKGVSKWVKEMQKVTKMERDPSSGSAIQEVNFWLNLEDALRKMKEKRESVEIELTMDVLKQGKRFHATVSFDSDTGLAKKLEEVMDYNPLMKDFPKCIDTLLKASDTDELRTAVVDVFAHLKKIRNTKYPVARALKLVAAISQDLNERLLKMLGNQRLMQARDDDFERIISGCKRVFNTWDDEDEMYRNILRELIKRHSRRDDGVKTFRRVKPQHEVLKKRLEELGTFRKQHDQLRNVIGRVLRPTSQDEAAGMVDADDATALEEVDLAYKDVEMVDALDLTEVGVRAWQSVQKRYSERIETVEIRIIAKLNDQLSKAKNANEMFRIFKKFNALFVRPKIKGAIREYQTQLIERVKNDIDQLHTKFKVQFAKTMNARMSEVRDLPPVSSLIIWVKQIDRQLTEYMNRVEDVLGKDWGGHREGRALKQNEAGFRKDLNTLENQAFTEWKDNVEKRQIGVTGRIFNIDMHRKAAGNSWELSVNFHDQIVTLSKEVRNLKWLKYRVPLVIVNKALQANHLYPFAISLKASIRTYRQTLEKLTKNEEASSLVASYHKTIQNCISEGVTLRWESYRLEPYVSSLAEAVFIFQDKVDDLLTYNKQLSSLIGELETCPLEFAAFGTILAAIQKVVDDLNLKAYVNLDAWAEQLDKNVEEKLVARLAKALQLWLVALECYGEKSHGWDARDSGLIDDEVKESDLPAIGSMEHIINFRNQVMVLNPPAENARENLFTQLQAHLAIIMDLPRIHSAKFVRAGDSEELIKSKTTYRTLLTKLPEGGAELVKAYDMIDARLMGVRDYVKIWLQYQSLWDIQSHTLVDRLGDDLEKWQQLLVEIKKARTHFDTSENTKVFGPVVINFAQVQTKVNLKYDSLHSDVLKRFGAKMHDGMEQFYKDINAARSDLESASIDSASTAESVAIITTIQALKRKVGAWTNSMNLFKVGERLLERQRFGFPEDWRYADYVEGEWNAFTEILSRKDGQITSQLPQLQMKVTDEDRILSKRVNDLLADWGRSKPVGNNVDPNEAINSLVIFEGRFSTIKEEYDSLKTARIALDLDVRPDDRIDTSLEELRDLKSSWGELGKVFTAITKLKEIPWAAVVPRKVKKALEDIIDELRNLPARVRSYASYESTLAQVQEFLQANKVITDLKSEALKDRHWKVLLKKLGLAGTILADLTLGTLFELDLPTKKSAIASVMLEAQGELALEKFLQQTEEEWAQAELELVNYQNKTKLIKGWQDLFDLAKDRLASLSQMKLSPYFAAFKEKTEAWDTKLNNVMLIFEIWMLVQEKWVYLEGIFLGSADIRTLLPSESSRFQSISTEFLSLMKKVSQNPVIIDVIALPNVHQTLERLEQLLVQIKKALADYLERQRALFPRFYFVGDNDLLEIIGNSKDVEKLQRHFRKLFSGVHSIVLTDDNESVIGCASMEGETVMYTKPVKVAGEKINVWLTNMDKEISVTLASLLAQSTVALGNIDAKVVENGASAFERDEYLAWVDTYQAQLVVLSTQVSWSERTDAALSSADPITALTGVHQACKVTLDNLADTVLLHQPPVRRTKLEHLITEIVHQRDVTMDLINNEVKSAKHFDWLAQMRFYFNPKETDVVKQLRIKIANAEFSYGFEYLGLGEKLVQTPLTDVAFTTLTQGLKARQGGSPFGPAGTGKTESVKMLGRQLGRWCLVFNCDETFDSEAMQRILTGLCQVGAFGCFDEFNRLEEAQLSAVSQQIQAIQEALVRTEHEQNVTVEVVPGNPVPLSGDVGVFITMNPGYAGRSALPDNLKKLFRQLAMTKPDGELIAQVMLFSQGFRSAAELARKVVPLFKLCDEQLSKQAHYDFGLRALKAVLISAGNIKRDTIARLRTSATENGDAIDEDKIAAQIDEPDMLIKSVSQTMLPKLVGADDVLLRSLLQDVFPNAECTLAPVPGLREMIEEVCEEQCYVANEKFLEKIMQLYQVTEIAHGLMMVGPSGAGKSAAWNVLLEALRRFEKKDAHSYVIDPKAISKDDLYGYLDPTTREWTDGVFTSIVRRVIDNKLGELNKRQWIVFDGDVDPEWVENLNSVLDDNKLLTLPNGERLALPKCLRVIFEVQDLKNATLATVSRCGMIWFSEEVLDLQMQFFRFLKLYRTVPITKNAEASLVIQNQVADVLAPHFEKGGLVEGALEVASGLNHIMTFSNIRSINSLFCVLKTISRHIIGHNENSPDFPISADSIEKYTSRQMVNYLMWSLVGDSKNEVRKQLSDYLLKASTVPLPEVDAGGILIDFHVSLDGNRPCDWVAWVDDVPIIDIQADKIAGTDVVIPTVDTERHVDMLYTWLADHLPVVLCGPPGSGKTMTLVKALRRSNDFVEALVNFSSSTTPQVLLDTFAQYCEYRKTPNGLVLAPRAAHKWLVVFCDEVNLPATDKYNTVRVITFLRQLVERGGFWRAETLEWVTTERIQFVGACNPPTDPGRVPFAMRFLRHVPVIYVDYPTASSYKQIYGTFNRALMKLHPEHAKYAEPLTDAMVDFFMETQDHFTADMQPFYIYSPREMTRWIKGIKECIWSLDSMTPEDLVRIWAHEALRLFSDRLVYPSEREWTDAKIDACARKYFPTVDCNAALQRPILFSNWMSKNYVPVELPPLREFVQARMKVFHEEALDVPLVLFDDVLDHVLRIDRIFKQNQGHCLLIGVAGGGKTTLSRFVAWMNGLSVVQVKVHNQYTADDFDADLRLVLRRSGCEGEKIAFILDEGNVMDTAFLERMNTLLANGEVPGLFEGDEYASLMTQCKQASQRDGQALDGEGELYEWFSKQILKNLHVVFTMNPSQEEGAMADRAATSPALFNRCVLDWYGDWSDQACYQVSTEFTLKTDLEKPEYMAPATLPICLEGLNPSPSHREAVNNAFLHVHQSAKSASKDMRKREGRSTHITPRHLLETVNQFVSIYKEKTSKLEEEKRHLGVGLRKLESTFEQVAVMKKELAVKRNELERKDVEAAKAMDIIVQESSIANDAKREATVLKKDLGVALEAADVRKAEVKEKLANVEPAVEAAKAAVGQVNKKALEFIKALANPPKNVKDVCEAVCILLGEGAKVKDWKNVRAIMLDGGFIQRVLGHNSDDVTNKIKNALLVYTDTGETNEEIIQRATRASAATGALMTWVLAKLQQIEVLLQIEPLRNELAGLTAKAGELQVASDENVAKLAVLEANIVQMKKAFSETESAKQVIKIDLDQTESKVGRAQALLDSLADEKQRWTAQDADFAVSMQYIIGDSLLAASFLAYAGYFNQSYRGAFMNSWTDHLTAAGIAFKPGLSIPDYLSTPESQLLWEKHGLPTDELCSENAVMVERGMRYPLVIDPAGQAKMFLQQQYKSQKVIETSFSNPGFRKSLESAIRFGTPLIVRDAEKYDPIMNPVLNREYHRTGGRLLITIGDQEIDMSPSVTIVLTASEPAYEFPPDLCSRVTMANFTVTRGSLQSQCLSQALKAERPDVEAKRTDLLKQNGEFRARLFALENELLQSLNEAEGSLLDDDKVIKKLQTIKNEASEINAKVAHAGEDMKEILLTENMYRPLAKNCSDIFFTMEQLHMVNFFYRYSLGFFLDIFEKVITHNPNLKDEKDHAARVTVIRHDLFAEVFLRVAPGLLQHDRLPFAMQLATIYVTDTPDRPSDAAIAYFFEGGVPDPTGTSGDFKGMESDGHIDHMTAIKASALSRKVPAFAGLASGSEGAAFKAWLVHPSPEGAVPDVGQNTDGSTETVVAFRNLLLIQAFRPDRVLDAASNYVENVFGKGFLSEQPGRLASAIESESHARTPIMLFGVAGYDASTTVQDIARAAGMGSKLKEIAVGSGTAFAEAEQAIDGAAKRGTWVMIKNVHLAPKQLDRLFKKMLQRQLHDKFRLFLSTEINEKLPQGLLMQSINFVFEPAAGVKESLKRTLNSFSAEEMEAAPAERSRMYVLVAWLHAVIQERLRYTPLGWSTKYEFGEPDLRAAIYTVNQWMTDESKGKANLPPDKIPFPALRQLISSAVYGGRVDNFIDDRLLASFVNSIFTPRSFEYGYPLVKDGADGSPGVMVPEGTKRDQFLVWANDLPDKEQPYWIGLPNSAQKVLKQNLALELLSKFLKMQTADEGEAVISGSGDVAVQQTASWMAGMQTNCMGWMEKLPSELPELQITAVSIKDPLCRFFNREVAVAIDLLRQVREDLEQLIEVCEGRGKLTNYINALKDDLIQGQVPKAWLKYTFPGGVTTIVWIADFVERCKQYTRIAEHAKTGKNLRTAKVWLGGLMEPAAFFTASRQSVAQATGISLEQLRMEIAVGGEADDRSLILVNLRFEGGRSKDGALHMMDEMSVTEEATVLKWIAGDATYPASEKVRMPIYMNCSRKQLIDQIDFKAAAGTNEGTFYERGAALICSALGGV